MKTKLLRRCRKDIKMYSMRHEYGITYYVYLIKNDQQPSKRRNIDEAIKIRRDAIIGRAYDIAKHHSNIYNKRKIYYK
jgi:hypothetical protein